ncbi:hypothetical protein [Nannocystis pusilla]|jgi:hypothetical protein|uniref:hypothetical protein n=1 Tax=Nannocystis pusilla TaxID=889268 RepID=UPI003DA5F9EF
MQILQRGADLDPLLRLGRTPGEGRLGAARILRLLSLRGIDEVVTAALSQNLPGTMRAQKILRGRSRPLGAMTTS